MNDLSINQLMSEYLELRTDLLRFLTARLGDRATAEDVYQELYVRLSGAHPRGELENPRGFIYRSAYNLANEYARAQQRRIRRDGTWAELSTYTKGTDAVSDVPDADAAIEAKRRLALLMSSLDELTPKCREVFTQHHLRGLSHSEIALSMGVSVKAVEKQMTVALKHLAAKLGFIRLHN